MEWETLVRRGIVGLGALFVLTWLTFLTAGLALVGLPRAFFPAMVYRHNPSLPAPTPSPMPQNNFPTLGIMGVPAEAFPQMVALRANAVEYRGSTQAPNIQAAFDAARAQGLDFLVRGPSRRAFTTPDGRLDLAGVNRVLRTMFDGTTFLGDSAFLGLYLIDEPCHPDKYNLTAADLAQLHAAVKAYHPGLNLFINFGTLSGCLDAFLAEAGGAPIADIAAFTVTVRKTGNPRYLPTQVEAARQAKATDARLRVVPMLAVWEGANMPLPSEPWVRDTGQALASAGVFDGVLFYPWSTPPWATRSLDDVIDTYADDVRWVFTAFLSEE